jgi:hypothetical protein
MSKPVYDFRVCMHTILAVETGDGVGNFMRHVKYLCHDILLLMFFGLWTCEQHKMVFIKGLFLGRSNFIKSWEFPCSKRLKSSRVFKNQKKSAGRESLINFILLQRNFIWKIYPSSKASSLVIWQTSKNICR